MVSGDKNLSAPFITYDLTLVIRPRLDAKKISNDE
jgi:hypothetical protein